MGSEHVVKYFVANAADLFGDADDISSDSNGGERENDRRGDDMEMVSEVHIGFLRAIQVFVLVINQMLPKWL